MALVSLPGAPRDAATHGLVRPPDRTVRRWGVAGAPGTIGPSSARVRAGPICQTLRARRDPAAKESEAVTWLVAKPLVMVGVDGSAESVGALKWAAAYAGATGASVKAVLSWHYPAAAGPAPVGVAPQVISDEVRCEYARRPR